MDSWWDLRTPYVNLVGFLSKYARLLVWQLCSWFGSYGIPGYLSIFGKTYKCERDSEEKYALLENHWKKAAVKINILPLVYPRLAWRKGKVGRVKSVLSSQFWSAESWEQPLHSNSSD